MKYDRDIRPPKDFGLRAAHAVKSFGRAIDKMKSTMSEQEKHDFYYSTGEFKDD